MKKFLSILVAGLMALSMGICSYAEPEEDVNYDDIIDAEYLYAESASSSLSISSSKKATCKSVVKDDDGEVTKIVLTQVLQKKDGSNWVTYAGWGGTFNQSSVTSVRTREPVSSGSYRFKTIAKVYKGTKYETITTYSKAVSC